MFNLTPYYTETFDIAGRGKVHSFTGGTIPTDLKVGQTVLFKGSEREIEGVEYFSPTRLGAPYGVIFRGDKSGIRAS